MTIVPVSQPDEFIQARRGVLHVCQSQIENGTVTIVRIIESIGHSDSVGDFYPNKHGIQVFGAEITGRMLQELHQELLSRSLTVNCEGFCFVYTGSRDFPWRIGEGGYNYRLYDVFNWSKYGVVPSTNTTSFIWTPRSLPPSAPGDSHSGVEVRQGQNESAIVSQEYRLNQHNLFIDCRDVESGRIVVWEVQAPGGKLSSVRVVAVVVGNGEQYDRLEVHGVSIEKEKLRELATELWARAVMLREKNDKLKDCKSEVEEKEGEVCVLEDRLKEKDEELKDCKLRLEKEKKLFNYKKRLKEKDQKLSECRMKLKEKKSELFVYKKQVEEKKQELEKCKSKLKGIQRELELSKSKLKQKGVELKQKENEFESQLEKIKDQELRKMTRRFCSEQKRTKALQLVLDKIKGNDEECEDEESVSVEL
ncbi:hypothetical protein L6164_003005 [Bauhinia variegata]|uniref:Uncharacterized protein n=1 Tax=Bauhinia variegata TaxID=167791 RepID=A0ACB9Q2P1_BAUVA|nr:hypothetical protein L6164_003005 [Bauhinia variegata]